MTNEEAKQAFFDRKPVTYGGRQYDCIHAIIYRYDRHNKLVVSAELWDRGENSVILVNLKDITQKEENDVRPN